MVTPSAPPDSSVFRSVPVGCPCSSLVSLSCLVLLLLVYLWNGETMSSPSERESSNDVSQKQIALHLTGALDINCFTFPFLTHILFVAINPV